MVGYNMRRRWRNHGADKLRRRNGGDRVIRRGCFRCAYFWRRLPGLPGDFDSKRWPANIASAIGDALIFPTLSFMAFMPEISAMQFISKMAAVTVITIIMRRYFTFEGRK